MSVGTKIGVVFALGLVMLAAVGWQCLREHATLARSEPPGGPYPRSPKQARRRSRGTPRRRNRPARFHHYRRRSVSGALPRGHRPDPARHRRAGRLIRDNAGHRKASGKSENCPTPNSPNCGRRSNCGASRALRPPCRSSVPTGARKSWTTAGRGGPNEGPRAATAG